MDWKSKKQPFVVNSFGHTGIAEWVLRTVFLYEVLIKDQLQ